MAQLAQWHGQDVYSQRFFFIVLTAGLVPQRSIEGKFVWLTQDYLAYCTRKGFTGYLRELNRDTFGFDSAASSPQGSWNKAVISTHLMIYLQDFCSRFVENKTDDFLLCSLDSWLSLVCCFSVVYKIIVYPGVPRSCFFSLAPGGNAPHHEHFHVDPLRGGILDSFSSGTSFGTNAAKVFDNV